MKKHHFPRKRPIKKDWIFLIIISIILISTTIVVRSSSIAGCSCKKLSSTNIPAMDEDSAGSALAFYLTQTFDLMKSERTRMCDADYYRMNFATQNDRNRTLFIKTNGDVYAC